ncbi:GNAT family N-acetyltransferase [Candidatus Dependentiae bacterium]|nr:GNAT family N-acetyltransferase [Candidatus Dependentiae bacterium]
MLVPLPILDTECLILRPIITSDAKDIFEYAKDFQITKFVPWYPHKTIDDTNQFVNKIIKGYEEKKSGPWAIVYKANNKVIGTIGFDQNRKRENISESSVNFGYCLSRAYWGQGLIVEASLITIEYLFNSTDIIEVRAFVQVGNKQSERVLEKLGFKKDPTIRKKEISKGQEIELECWILSKSFFSF